MKILAVNAGSSSLKVQLLEMPEEKLIAKATVERIGANDAIVTVKYDFKNGTNETYYNNNYPIADHAAAVKAITDKFAEFHVIENVDEIKGVGHRVVQGGEYFKKTEVVTDDVCKKVLELAELAPHHNKAEYNGYMAFKEIFPNAIHTMVFDNSFRSEQSLILAMAEMIVNGIATIKMTKVMETLCDTSFSKSTVSDC